MIVGALLSVFFALAMTYRGCRLDSAHGDAEGSRDGPRTAYVLLQAHVYDATHGDHVRHRVQGKLLCGSSLDV